MSTFRNTIINGKLNVKFYDHDNPNSLTPFGNVAAAGTILKVNDSYSIVDNIEAGTEISSISNITDVVSNLPTFFGTAKINSALEYIMSIRHKNSNRNDSESPKGILFKINPNNFELANPNRVEFMIQTPNKWNSYYLIDNQGGQTINGNLTLDGIKLNNDNTLKIFSSNNSELGSIEDSNSGGLSLVGISEIKTKNKNTNIIIKDKNTSISTQEINSVNKEISMITDNPVEYRYYEYDDGVWHTETNARYSSVSVTTSKFNNFSAKSSYIESPCIYLRNLCFNQLWIPDIKLSSSMNINNTDGGTIGYPYNYMARFYDDKNVSSQNINFYQKITLNNTNFYVFLFVPELFIYDQSQNIDYDNDDVPYKLFQTDRCIGIGNPGIYVTTVAPQLKTIYYKSGATENEFNNSISNQSETSEILEVVETVLDNIDDSNILLKISLLEDTDFTSFENQQTETVTYFSSNLVKFRNKKIIKSSVTNNYYYESGYACNPTSNIQHANTSAMSSLINDTRVYSLDNFNKLHLEITGESIPYALKTFNIGLACSGYNTNTHTHYPVYAVARQAINVDSTITASIDLAKYTANYEYESDAVILTDDISIYANYNITSTIATKSVAIITNDGYYDSSLSNGTGQVSVGSRITNNGNNSIAIGYYTRNLVDSNSETNSGTANNSIAIGYNATTQNGGTNIGAGGLGSSEFNNKAYVQAGGSDSTTEYGQNDSTSLREGLTLGVRGELWVYKTGTSTGWYHTSDIRDKTDFKDIQTALPFINSIHPTTFVHNDRADYIQINEKGEKYFDEKSYLSGIKKGHRRIAGFRAQEVYEALKNNYNSDNYASVVSYGNYTGSNGMDKYFLSEEAMVPFLTRAIQEQQEQIEALKSEIAELKNIIKDNKPNKINEEVEEKSNENESNENE